MSTTLKEVFKPKATSGSSSKTPKFYNEEKNLCLAELASDKDAIVRTAIACNTHTPTKILVGMLEVETTKQVLRTVLFNDKLPRKAIAKFVNDKNDERVEWFEGDVELIDHLTRE